jgi:GNAT superfamily N-acetyltransferase
MMGNFISLDSTNLEKEHICCAISDKKCRESYELKKIWLKKEFENGYVFRRLDARAKVFIEYGAAEKAWVPVEAQDYLLINCLWVSGKYKKQGFAKELLEYAWKDVKHQGKKGLVTIVGKKKFHFMSEGKWFLRQGFKVCDETESGFKLFVKRVDKGKNDGSETLFPESVKRGDCEDNGGIVVYYSHRCPFAEYHVKNSLRLAAESMKVPLKIIHLKTMSQAQKCPSPATIFSLFYKGKFITTDLSVCMEKRFEKLLNL